MLQKVCWLMCFLLSATCTTTAQAADENWRARGISLRDSGFASAVTLNANKREQHFYFPVAQNVKIRDARLELELTYLHQFPSTDGLTIQVNGISTRVVSLSSGTTPLLLRMTGLDDSPLSTDAAAQARKEYNFSIPLKDLDPAARLIDVTVSFNSEINSSRCTEVSGMGNEVQISPDSRLHYLYDTDSVSDIRSFLTTLPKKPQLFLPSSLNKAQYEGTLNLLMGMRNLGLDPQLARLPVAGDEAPVTGLHLPGKMSGKTMFENIEAAIEYHRPLQIKNEEDIASWLALRLIADAGFADVVIDSSELGNALIKAGKIWDDEDVLPLMPGWLQKAVADRWRIQNRSTSSSLSVENWLGTQLMLLDDADINPAALLTGSFWSSLSNSARLNVARSSPLSTEPAQRLLIARNLPVKYLGNSIKWELPFHAKDLPEGKRPDSVQLNILAANRNADSAAVVSVFMNDYLLTAQKLNTDGEVTLVSASVPLYSLKASNMITVQVSGPAQKNCTSPQATPVQILPSSHVGLTGAGTAMEFFSLIPALTHNSEVIVPQAYLLHPETTLATVSKVLQSLQMSAGNYHLRVENGSEFSAKEKFVSFEVAPKKLNSLIETGLDKLIIRDKTGAVVFNSEGLGSLSVAQLIEGKGILVSRVGRGEKNLEIPFELSAGNLAVMDSQGVKLVLNTNDPAQEWNFNQPNRGLKHFVQRYRTALSILGWLLALGLAIWATKVAWSRALARRTK